MIAVMGMHRSGTSMVAGLLHHAGFKSRNTLDADKWNPPGYFEDVAVMRTNDVILWQNGRGAWDNPPEVIREGIRQFPPVDLVKDPRFCITWPAWDTEGVKVVKVLRDPSAICESLSRRDGFDKKKALGLTWKYLTAMDTIEGLELHYEDLLEGEGIDKLSLYVGLRIPADSIDPKLNRCGEV